jgi:hypothetical protein
MAGPLFHRHSAGLAATYADLENQTLARDRILAGTPGAVTERSNAGGARFYVRQYYDFAGRKRDEYLGGQPGTPAGEALLLEWQRNISDANDAVRSARLLAREGYATITPKQFAALRPLGQLFRGGALLVGTHAFGAIANRMGMRTIPFATEDIDIGRGSKLSIDPLPPGGLLELLRESGIEFDTVPPLDPRQPSTKFKERGRSRFMVDLLVPTRGDEVELVEVPELRAHATALPYFRYLVSESQEGIVMSTHGAMGVRLPLPERFALHKLLVSQLRKGRPEKSLKDLRQASARIAFLGEMHPGAITEAFAKTPVSARRHIRRSLDQIHEDLAPHPQALEEISAAAAKAAK